jgi:hypothetical protein
MPAGNEANEHTIVVGSTSRRRPAKRCAGPRAPGQLTTFRTIHGPGARLRISHGIKNICRPDPGMGSRRPRLGAAPGGTAPICPLGLTARS